jgi:superfamily II DNA or RNA helicase
MPIDTHINTRQRASQKSGQTSGRSARGRRRHKAAIKLSRTHRPENMSLEDWQTELRRQFGREQKFQLKNSGDEPIFSDFQVTNPQSKSTYRVSIRGEKRGESFCSCPDFATNTLGTCKHLEFALAKLARRPGARQVLRQGFRPAYSEVRLEYGAQRVVRFKPGVDCPAALLEAAKYYFNSDGVLNLKSFGKFEEFLAAASEASCDLRCDNSVLAFIAEVRDREDRQRRIEKAFPQGNRSTAFDRLLRVGLYDYQREGALFAARAGRSLIADEMGLGKTIQAIGAAEIMAREFGVERVLIVCPTSLKHQWEREIEKFIGRTATVVGGLRARREISYAAESFYKIINYDTVHADLDLIANWSPDLVILDEAQRIKNWSTRIARSVKKIASPYAIVLTGTPLENRLEELVSIVQFVDRHRLGPTFRFLADHQVTDEHGKVVGYKDLDTIGTALAPILIRRQKQQVLKQLPERMDKHYFVPMTTEQMRHHTENRELVAKLVHKWKRFKFLSEADRRRLMIFLQNMRMSCDSTYLLDRETDFGVKADELATLLGDIFEEPDAKVVIFSQWLGMHEVLLRRFQSRHWQHVLFHGGVPGTKRKGLVDRFVQDADCRTFLATDAGGVGLNLQHASVVINMDLPWNPAVLEQRIGRVHRLGQSRPVRVINFVSQGTIEEGMLSVIKFKKSLFAGALDNGETDVFLGGSRLGQFIQTVEKATGAIPAVTDEPASPAEVAAGASTDADPVRQSAAPVPAPQQSELFAGLLRTGLDLLQQIVAASRPPADGNGTRVLTISDPAGVAASFVQRDAATGQPYLRLPVPSPEVLDRTLEAVGSLLELFRR